MKTLPPWTKSGFVTSGVPASGFVSDLDTPLLKLSQQGDVMSTRDGCGGIHFWGGMGGGKTSSAQMVAGAYLRAGFGGYVTAAKNTAVTEWQHYARIHGRSRSLVLLDETEGFNFLDYEMARHGMDGIGTVVDCLMRVIDSARKASGTSSQRGGDSFWEDSARNALRYTLPPIYSAKGSLTIPDILRFVTTAPATLKEPTSPGWQERSFMYKMMNAATSNPKVRIAGHSLQNLITFWAEQWPGIPEKTRGNIVITITAALDRFNHGRLNRFFCGKTTVVPEMSFHGTVFVDAKPTLTWNEDGVIAQQLFKYIWQRCVLNRNSLEAKHRERPLMQWSDEAQETVHPYDGEFLGLTRESKCCVVALSQSLPTYYAKIGGDNPRDAAEALAGKFRTHVFCTNSCPVTNEFASRMIGKVVKRHYNFSRGSSDSYTSGLSQGSSETSGTSSSRGSSSSTSAGGGATNGTNSSSGHSSSIGSNWGMNQSRGTSSNTSRGYSESMEYAVEPGDFGRALKTGGPANNNLVTAIWFQSGRIFKSTGQNFMLETFKQ